jgi:hypothetical protein
MVTTLLACALLSLSPLTAVPQLDSLPGAAISLYLDFDGDFQASWAGYNNIRTPAYTLDLDATTFSDAELAAIRKVWEYVAEDYAPFNVNVTTVRPADMGLWKTLHCVIGGTGAWRGGGTHGVSYQGGFNGGPNVVFAFAEKRLAKGTAFIVSHESGHGFVLDHQRVFDATGRPIAEYYLGPGDGRAPIMGGASWEKRILWWSGTWAPGLIQDDMARLATRLGYRPDDHGNDAAHATPLTAVGSTFVGAGVVGRTGDLDVFSFVGPGGPTTITVGVSAETGNLDARLELHDAAGNMLAMADPADVTSAQISATLTPGAYYAVVGSHGSYGDVGQYSLAVGPTTTPTPAPTPTPTPMPTPTPTPPPSLKPPAPADLTAVSAAPTSIQLRWTGSPLASSYRVDRIVSTGVWGWVGTTTVPEWLDKDLTTGKKYTYRVWALSPAGAGLSTVVTATPQ